MIGKIESAPPAEGDRFSPIRANPMDARMTPDHGRSTRYQYAALLLLSLSLNLVGNGSISLWDRDEPRYAGCAREMRASGDWVGPTFNAEPRYHKPALIYWLMQGGIALGGDNPFGARLVSALAGAATCLVVFGLGRRMIGARAGLWAGVVAATAPFLVFESKMATTDAVLMLLFALAQWSLWELGRKDSRAWSLGFWAALGLAVLDKGPAAPALLLSSGMAAVAFGSPWRVWGPRRLGWASGLALFGAIVLPWYVAIGIRSGGEFFRVMIGYHTITRATSGIESHGGFPGYYVVGLVLTFLPWTLLLPIGLKDAWAARREHPAAPFLLGWAIGPLILLEVMRTKLIHYYLPALPACALLVGWTIDRGLLRAATARRLNWSIYGLSTGLVVALLALPGVVDVVPVGPCLAIATTLAGVGLVISRQLRSGDVRGMAGTWATGMGLMTLLVFGWLIPSLEPYRLANRVGERLAGLSRETGSEVALITFRTPAVIYGIGHPVAVPRDLSELDGLIDQRGSLITALLPVDLARFQARGTVQVDDFETMEGFDVEKGKTTFVHLSRLSKVPGPVAARATTVR